MNRKIIKIGILFFAIIILVGGGIALYLHFNQRGQIVGQIEFGRKYYLQDIRPTAVFDGAEIHSDSYLQFDQNQKTGKLYLVGYSAAPITLIITNYKEGVKQTTIDFEFILPEDETAVLYKMTAQSNDHEIRIKDTINYSVKIIQQNKPDVAINEISYPSTMLVFTKEVA